MSNKKPPKEAAPETITAIAKPADKVARPITQAFVPELEAVAASSFIFNGVAYEPQADFPHKAMNVDKSTLNGLWLAGLIRFVQPPAIEHGRIEKLVAKLKAWPAPEDRDDGAAVEFDKLVDELANLARGAVSVLPPPPVVYKEDPEDEPDPEVLKAQMAAVKATVPKPPARTDA